MADQHITGNDSVQDATNASTDLAELLVPLDKNDALPLWVQLRDQIIVLISERRLPYGAKMPTVRNLAKSLGVSVSVVNQAYRFLKVTGYLTARQGSGVKVRQRMDAIREEDFPAITRMLDEFVGKCRAFNMTNLDIMDTLQFYFGYQDFVETEGVPPRSAVSDKIAGMERSDLEEGEFAAREGSSPRRP